MAGPPKCIVPGCDGFFLTSQAGPYFLVKGRSEDIIISWLRACTYSEEAIEQRITEITPSHVICASHFIGQHFNADVANQRVPSVFPWSECVSDDNSRNREDDDSSSESCEQNADTSSRKRTAEQFCNVKTKEAATAQRATNLSDTARRLSDLIASKRAILMNTSELSIQPNKKSRLQPHSVEPAPAPKLKPTGPSRCIVPECDGYFKGESKSPVFKPKYFTLPVKDEKLMKEWLLAIGLSKENDLSAGKICCTHFKDGLFNLNDPLHRMPIVFAPRKLASSQVNENASVAAPVQQALVPEPKKSGLKPHMKPHFSRKPVPESESKVPNAGPKSVSRPQIQSISSEDESDSENSSHSDSNTSSSDSVQMMSAMPKIHSAAMPSGLRGSSLNIITPENLCSMIIDQYYQTNSENDDGGRWQGLVENDPATTKSFGFEKFLCSLGLDIVRKRVYKTALKASQRNRKLKKEKFVLSEEMKSSVTKAVDHFESDLGLAKLDTLIVDSKLGKQTCNRCAFSSESRLVVDWHRRQPHFDRTKHGYVFCCMCPVNQQHSMKITMYREHLRYMHGCSFIAFDLFSQPYQCHYCNVCCASWKVLLSHMNNCRLTFNINENLRLDPKTDRTLAVNLTKPPTYMAIDKELHFENPLYQFFFDEAVKYGLRQPLKIPQGSVTFVDLREYYEDRGAQVVNPKALVPIGFDDVDNQEFARYFGYFVPPVESQTRTTILQVPQSTAIVQIVESNAPPAPVSPATTFYTVPTVMTVPAVPSPIAPPYQPPQVHYQPAPTQLHQPSVAPPEIHVQPRPLVQQSRPNIQTAPSRFSFAPPSELPSSFRPIRVAKLPEITMATIAAATAASKPPPAPLPAAATSGLAQRPSLIQPLSASTVPAVGDVGAPSAIKRPEPPFSGANSIMPIPKRFRQTEFCLTTMQRLLFCEICRGIVQEREALRIHLFWAHRIGLPPSVMMTDEWYTATCPECGVGFYTPDGIRQHQTIGCYSDIFVPTFCVVCHKFLSTSSLLCAHLAREHGLTPPSMTRARVCFICSSAFDTEEHCADHLRLGHQMTTEPNAEREDFINVIWQGQLVASVDPDAIGVEAAAAMLSFQAAQAYAMPSEDGAMLVERLDDSGHAGSGAIMGAFGDQHAGMSSANRALSFAARGGVAAPFRRGPGRPPLHARGPGRPRGSRARGPYRPRGTRGPYRPRGSRLGGSRGPGRPPLSNSASKRIPPKRRAPRDASAAGKAQWFHEEYSLSETDDEEFDPNAMMLEPDKPDMDAYDEEYYDEDTYSARFGARKFY